MKVANFLPSEVLIALSLSGRSYEFSKLPFVKYGTAITKGKNTGSHLFTEVKPCWTGLISGWVTI